MMLAFKAQVGRRPPMLVAIAFLAVFYLLTTLWFWSLCRASARVQRPHLRPPAVSSKLIPFERPARPNPHSKSV
jgi:hypothetical protein